MKRHTTHDMPSTSSWKQKRRSWTAGRSGTAETREPASALRVSNRLQAMPAGYDLQTTVWSEENQAARLLSDRNRDPCFPSCPCFPCPCSRHCKPADAAGNSCNHRRRPTRAHCLTECALSCLQWRVFSRAAVVGHSQRARKCLKRCRRQRTHLVDEAGGSGTPRH